MRRIFKWLVVLAFGAGLLGAGSYAGARSTAGRLLGPDPPNMGTRSITLGFDSIPGLSGKQLAWTLSYSPNAFTGRRPVRIYISPTGRLLRTVPRNLEDLIDQYYESREPS